jgi:hypothetical protein
MTNNLAIKEVNFYGDKLYAAHEEINNKTYIGVRWVCDGIGLSEGQRKNEIKRIKDDLVLKQGGRNLILPTNGGEQMTQCIELDFLPLWLAKISITPKMQKENEILTKKLVKYQLEAKDVLTKAFVRNPTGFDVLRGMLDKIEESNKKVDLLTLKQQETDNKVVNMQTYLTETPDRKKIQKEVNTYARRNNMQQSEVWTLIYQKIEDKYGFSVSRRVDNKHKKMNEERIAKGKNPYSVSYLKQKYNGVDAIFGNGYEKEVMEILAGIQ